MNDTISLELESDLTTQRLTGLNANVGEMKFHMHVCIQYFSSIFHSLCQGQDE